MLPSQNRFHRRNHVNRVHKQGTSVRGKDISLKYRYNDKSPSKRIAVVVSKKVSKSAVTRNRIRRRVFEIIRGEMDTLDDGFEGVFAVFRDSTASMPHDELKKHIRDLLGKVKSA